MTIYSALINDHKKVEKLFEDIEKYRNSTKNTELDGKVKEIFSSIRNELTVHSKSEEIEFYDFLFKKKDLKNILLESKEEHSIIEKMLTELNHNSHFDDKWFAKLHELKEIVEHHVKEEENKLFPKAKRVISKEEEKIIEDNFHDRKSILSK